MMSMTTDAIPKEGDEYGYLSADTRKFLEKNNVLPKEPKKGKKEEFKIYDGNGKKYPAELDSYGRIWCKEWLQEYDLDGGDNFFVCVFHKMIILHPV